MYCTVLYCPPCIPVLLKLYCTVPLVDLYCSNCTVLPPCIPVLLKLYCTATLVYLYCSNCTVLPPCKTCTAQTVLYYPLVYLYCSNCTVLSPSTWFLFSRTSCVNIHTVRTRKLWNKKTTL